MGGSGAADQPPADMHVDESAAPPGSDADGDVDDATDEEDDADDASDDDDDGVDIVTRSGNVVSHDPEGLRRAPKRRRT